MNIKLGLAFLFLICFYNVSFTSNNKKIGLRQMPNITLQDDSGKWQSLRKIKGKKVIFFYPKDDSPNCTAQACSFRDNISLYNKHNITVIGISYDSIKKHDKFKKKHKLPTNMILLSDENGDAAKAFGADRGLLGSFFAQRKTFLIDENENIINILEDINVSTHATDVLKLFKLF